MIGRRLASVAPENRELLGLFARTAAAARAPCAGLLVAQNRSAWRAALQVPQARIRAITHAALTSRLHSSYHARTPFKSGRVKLAHLL